MTDPASAPAPGSPPAPTRYVLPENFTNEHTGRGPRFDDDDWDFTPFVPRTVHDAHLPFSRLQPDSVAVAAAKEYLYSRINRAIPTTQRAYWSARPIKLTWLHNEFNRYVMVIDQLRELGITRLADVTQEHLDELVRAWSAGGPAGLAVPGIESLQSVSPRAVAGRISVLKRMAAHRHFMTRDRLTFDPWPGRPAMQIAQCVAAEENVTPRIPEPVTAAILKAALFYVTTGSRDITNAQGELGRVDATGLGRDRLSHGEAERRIAAFLDRRRLAGRGVPALPARRQARGGPAVSVVDGVVQAPNFRLIWQLADVRQAWHLRPLVWEAAAKLGYEEGGMDTPISPWPDSDIPWRPRFSRLTVRDEIKFLRVACWIVIAYLSGMRDVEVRELARDCAFTVAGEDGRTRYKLRGRVFKGRKLSGDDAEWVVLDVVHQAVTTLLEIDDDPTHLFGYRSQQGHYALLDDVAELVNDFRQHVDMLLGTADQPFVPLDGDQPWRFNTRQFRRTLAWHIAHQPYGVVAGTRQYKHLRISIFEGYAGTSESGFSAEVAAEEAVAMLDYVEELYRDWNDGKAATGGAAGRISAEFDRIRRELGDLPGVVASEARLRTMLVHLTKILHPGVLSDCFFDAATAVCVKRAKLVGRPVPQHNMCLRCPNARRSSIHLPRLAAARDQALDLHAQCDRAGPVPKLQQVAITSYIADLDQLIQSLSRKQDQA